MARILIVEDQPSQRRQLAEIFERYGFEVVEAGDGVESLEQARMWSPDLILMDLRMPRMDGITAIKVLRKTPKTADIPIIVITAWRRERIKFRACQAGANLYYTKPVDESRLVRDVNRLLAIDAAAISQPGTQREHDPS